MDNNIINILIYGGLGVCIIGAIINLFFGLKYYKVYSEIKQFPMKVDELKAWWRSRRFIGWGVMIAGTLIIFLACNL